MKRTLILLTFLVSIISIISGQELIKVNDVIIADEGGDAQGVSWVDYDNDGFIDVYISNIDYEVNLLYKNDGSGSFYKQTESSLVLNNFNTESSAWADFNNDGLIDVYLCNNGLNQLYKNLGEGTFEELPQTSIPADGLHSTSAAWSDYNNDGYLDLFVCNSNGNNMLYHNNGNETFLPIVGIDMTSIYSKSNVCIWGDYNNDGFSDLFVGNGNSENNFLYKNNGDGTFETISELNIVTDGGTSSSANWADFNNDGWLDLFVANYYGEQNFLYYNNGDGTFTRIFGEAPVNYFNYSKASCVTDLDNNGTIDILVGNAHASYSDYSKNKIYLNQGNGSYSELSGVFTSDTQPTASLALADYNNDGFEDVLAVARNGYNSILYQNIPNDNNWAAIQLLSTTSNASSIGASVRIKANIDGEYKWQMMELASSNGLRAQNSFILHFGLGNAQTIDSIEIRWPSGNVCQFYDIDANKLIKISEDCLILDVYEEQLNSKPIVNVYPNPASVSMVINVEGLQNFIQEIQLFDVTGKAVMQLHKLSNNKVNIDVRQLAPGFYTYLLKIINENGESVYSNGKFLVK
ncbi:MAG TPA: FG-GAP-like repeat-containing protein [Bacteroidales bacterium]|nr:FG-GAP-like repeat-containing protein [Bacteroidales bacterium]HRX98018.1 FG-GAP-like repeat-containing protein [Bacteroidales bacterium]